MAAVLTISSKPALLLDK